MARHTLSSWWTFSRIATKSFDDREYDAYRLCYRHQQPYLSKKQRETCYTRLDLMRAVIHGLKMSIKECKRLFKYRRWNCTTFANGPHVFGKMELSGHRESAFLQALTTASVVHTVHKRCYSGKIKNCNCGSGGNSDAIRKRFVTSSFKWSGCRDELAFGEKFARDFIDDENEVGPKSGLDLMRMRNNAAGRRAVRKSLRLNCTCYGASGSCTVRTCWNSTAEFSEIAEFLMSKYNSAKHVYIDTNNLISHYHTSLSRIKRNKKPKPFKLSMIDRKLKRPAKDDLVYVDFSPDYCQTNHELGRQEYKHI
ncbi:hypothetical protein HELRODRAFT_177374 [Helobdella robusta]|uniref:Protein Wnt n=1 Tax=Helobdella robusta TaxID=6412 RepID=T1FBL1_HELRO|nr:hypothetical protein HELRODRAFT_177374 [Helobdella robusta]ESN98133.1 hypothetical protein HELRODRAFT_177374 [Helobdella robusta]